MREAAEKKKGLLRFIPIASCDPIKLCGWLENMAEQGYALKHNGIRFGFASFEQGQPRKLRYCVDVTPTEYTASSKDWSYCSKYGNYYIYVSEESDPTPLHEQPDTALNAWKKQERNEWGALFWNLPIMILVLFPALLGNKLYLTLASSEWLLFVFYFIFGYIMVSHIRAALCCRRIRKALELDQDVPTTVPKKSTKALHYISLAFRILLVLGALVYCAYKLNFLPDPVGEPHISLSTFDSATEAWDIVPSEEPRTYSEDHGFLYPLTYVWREEGSLYAPDGTEHYISLDVNYHEARTPWLAQQLAEEYYERAQEFVTWDGELSLPEFDRAYVKEDMGSDFLLQKGKTLALVRIFTTYPEELPSELISQWADKIVATFES